MQSVHSTSQFVIDQSLAEPIFSVLKINHTKRELTKVRLKTYTGECIPPAGAIQVHIDYYVQQAKWTLWMGEGEGLSLLGRDLLQKISLIWGEKHLSSARHFS